MSGKGRPPGSGKEYRQALKTVEAAFYGMEKWALEHLDDAKAVIIEQLTDGSPQTKMASAKMILEIVDKFAKAHGKNPLPKDFLKQEALSVKSDDEDGEPVLNLKFGG